MKKVIYSLLLVGLVSYQVSAQTEKEDENLPVAVSDAIKGYIIDTSGAKIPSYIKLMGDVKTPWINQRIVKAIEESKLDLNSEKSQFKKYNKSDILGYSTADRQFKLIEFVNIRASIKSNKEGEEASVFDQMQSFKNMSKQKHFAEVLVDGKYKVYKLFSYPKDVSMTSGTAEEMKRQEAEELRSIIDNPSLLLQINDDKIKLIKIDDLESIAKDCEVIKAKLEKGDYDAVGYQKPKKKGLMGKMASLAKEKQVGNIEHQKLFVAFFSDLNQNCK